MTGTRESRMRVEALPAAREAAALGRAAAKRRTGGRLGALGWLAPAVLGAWMAADLLARLLNPALFQIDPWLAVSRCPPRYAPFTPGQSFSVRDFIGGNARQANVKPTETAGPIRFSTDRLGFRNNPYLETANHLETAKALPVLFSGGDSFTYGVGLSDEQTLPSVLTKQYGLASYNGGRFHDDPDGMPELDWLLEHLPSRPATVVYTYLEHRALVSPAEQTGVQGKLLRWNPRLEGDLRYGKLLNTFFWELSPARVITTRFFKRLSDGAVFPNDNASTVRSLRLPNGERLLFRDYEYLLPEQRRGPAEVAQTVRGFEWLRAELRKRNLGLVVLLLPNRYTVYAPALTNRDGAWAHYLDRLNGDLEARGFRTVNGLAVYRSTVRQEIESGQYSFYREDAHWNARGVEEIAGPVAEAVRDSLRGPGEGTGTRVIQ